MAEKGKITITSDDIKAAMLTHVLYRLHSNAAVTEYGGEGVIGIADVFAYLESGFTHEFEVKVSAADLAGELATIKYLVGKRSLQLGEATPEPPRGLSKTSKHNIYLGEKVDVYAQFGMQHRPNRFSYVVPPELEEKAKASLEGTPYGLYVATARSYGETVLWEPECKKKAGYIHKDRANAAVLKHILKKACTEVEVLRREKAKGRRCTKCLKGLPGRCENCDNSIKESREYNRKAAKCWLVVKDMDFGPERTKAYQECMDATK